MSIKIMIMFISYYYLIYYHLGGSMLSRLSA